MTIGKQAIIVCEPQCPGFEHVPVNAAMLAVLEEAFPEARLFFAAERSHLEKVAGVLQNKRRGERIEHVTMAIPRRDSNHIFRYPAERRLYRNIEKLRRSTGAKKLFFLSVTGPGLYIQRRFWDSKDNLLIINVVHGILESLYERPPLKSWKRPFWFPALFTGVVPDNIKFLVLSESIKTNLSPFGKHVMRRVAALEHPLFFHEPTNQSILRPVRLGAIGIAGRSKGTHLFFELATAFSVQAQAGKVDFSLVGPLRDSSLETPPAHLHLPFEKTMGSAEDFKRELQAIDYAVYLYDSQRYRLTASGAFMDAIAFAKPVIVLANSYFEYFFDMMGDIGFFCRSFDEARETVANLIEHPDPCRYRQQVANIVAGRQKISISAMAEKLLLTVGQHDQFLGGL